MRALFNWQRTGIFWWGVITALVFMFPETWTVSVSAFLRSLDTTSVDFIRPLSREIDFIAEQGLEKIQFDQKAALVYFGGFGIANLFVGVIFMILFFLIGIGLYARAIHTKNLVDDFAAMTILYIIMRVIGVASKKWEISWLIYVHEKEPTSYLIVLSIFMLLLLVRGKGFTDAEVFFKIIFEAIIVWTLVKPKDTILVLAWIVERPAMIHQFLIANPVIGRFYLMVVSLWALVGLGIAAVNLYGANRLAAPAGGGGGGSGGKGPPEE